MNSNLTWMVVHIAIVIMYATVLVFDISRNDIGWIIIDIVIILTSSGYAISFYNRYKKWKKEALIFKNL